MKIFQDNLNLDGRLGRTFDKLPTGKAFGSYLLIVHPVDATESVTDRLPKCLADPNCKGVLYVKGSAFGGLGTQAAADTALEATDKERVHFLSFAVQPSGAMSPHQMDRFKLFFANVLDRDLIDWRVIDPTIPESLIAVCLLAKTIMTVEGQTVLNDRSTWKHIVEDGMKELRRLIDPTWPHHEITKDNASHIASAIESFFQ